MESESKRRKLAVNCEGRVSVSSSTYADHGGSGPFGGGDDHILCEILGRLPLKSLMKFKSVCKHWKAVITQDRCLIDLFNARSEARQCHDKSTNHTTLFISPVRPCGSIDTTIPKSPYEIQTFDTIEEAGTEIKMMSFSRDHHGGSSGAAAVRSFDSNIFLPISSKKTPLELVSFRHTSTLEPICGLVCFVNLDNYGSVLIYNPSTREKTSWIRTRTSGLLEDVFFDQKLRGVRLDKSYDKRTVYSCMFGFGFDSATKKHKVLCIYQITTTESTCVSGEYGNYLETYCEVMTVSENIWREIDDDLVPQNMAIGQKSVHVNGSIYWMCYKLTTPHLENRAEVIMGFDVASETFRVIRIPTFILDRLKPMDLFQRTAKWTNELVDVDEHLAILSLKKYSNEEHHCIELWILEEETNISPTCSVNVTGDGAKWTKETLDMPYRWEELQFLTLKAIARTDLIIIRYFLKSSLHEPTKHEFLHCYDRKKRRCYRQQIDMISDHTRPYDITTFLETLTPVQTNMLEEHGITIY